jgi:hypothetical protein
VAENRGFSGSKSPRSPKEAAVDAALLKGMEDRLKGFAENLVDFRTNK